MYSNDHSSLMHTQEGRKPSGNGWDWTQRNHVGYHSNPGNNGYRQPEQQFGAPVQERPWENQQRNGGDWSYDHGRGEQFQYEQGYNNQNGNSRQENGRPYYHRQDNGTSWSGQRGNKRNWSSQQGNFNKGQNQNSMNIPIEIRREIKVRNELSDAAFYSKRPADKHAFQMQQKKVNLLLRQAGILNKKKEKIEKPKPFNCDCCDKGFATDEKLKDHIALHVTCNLDGCKFTGHPKIVEKHVEMQHLTGLASVISRLNTPEDIEKWRQERKKNYPTSANAEKKQKIRNERFARGEVIPERNFGKMYNNHRGSRGRGRGNSRFQRSTGRQFSNHRANCNGNGPENRLANHHYNAVTSPELEEGEIIDESKTAANYFHVTEGAGDSEEEDIKPTAPAVNPSLGGALGALMCAYGSDSSDNEESDTKSNTPVSDPITTKSAEMQKCSNLRNDASRNVNRNLVKPDARIEARDLPVRHQPYRPIRRQPYSLLEKLLSKEICHERNVIMQCVRYVVENKFFGVDEKPTKTGQIMAAGDGGYCSDSELN